MKTVPTKGPVPADPAVGAGAGDAHFLGHMGNRTAAQNAFDEDPPSGGGQAGITVFPLPRRTQKGRPN